MLVNTCLLLPGASQSGVVEQAAGGPAPLRASRMETSQHVHFGLSSDLLLQEQEGSHADAQLKYSVLLEVIFVQIELRRATINTRLLHTLFTFAFSMTCVSGSGLDRHLTVWVFVHTCQGNTTLAFRVTGPFWFSTKTLQPAPSVATGYNVRDLHRRGCKIRRWQRFLLSSSSCSRWLPVSAVC